MTSLRYYLVLQLKIHAAPNRVSYGPILGFMLDFKVPSIHNNIHHIGDSGRIVNEIRA